jgi:predicted membrane protein
MINIIIGNIIALIIFTYLYNTFDITKLLASILRLFKKKEKKKKVLEEEEKSFDAVNFAKTYCYNATKTLEKNIDLDSTLKKIREDTSKEELEKMDFWGGEL